MPALARVPELRQRCMLRLLAAVLGQLIACAAPGAAALPHSGSRPHDPAHGRSVAAPMAPAHWPAAALEATPLPDVDAMVRGAGVTSDAPFLVIGVLSSRRRYRRRVAVRSTWQRFVTHAPTASVHVRFVLCWRMKRCVVWHASMSGTRCRCNALRT
jgi:hypothetical protein